METRKINIKDIKFYLRSLSNRLVKVKIKIFSKNIPAGNVTQNS